MFLPGTGRAAYTRRQTMSRGADSFNDDLALAQACLASDAGACEEFEGRYGALIAKILSARGASPTEAGDLTRNLLSDCVAGGEALLRRYNGRCSLQSWLATCGTRRFIDYKRHESKKTDLPGNPDDDTADPFQSVVAPDASQSEASLTALLRKALEAAFTACPAESRFMLRLVYLQGLTQREIGRMWNHHESKVSRRLTRDMETIRTTTLAKVREIDPFLRLTWEDFLELCESSLTELPW